MNPVFLAPGNAYNFMPIIVPMENERFFDLFIGTLSACEQEAVDRVRDQFHSRAELVAFIKGLRG